MSAELEFSDQVTLRPMEAEDVPDVMVVEHLAYPQPWNEKVMRDCLRVNHYHAWVLEIDKAIKGYLFLSIVAGEMHILNICVHPELQGQGWGRDVLHRAFDLASNTYNANMCFLEVRPSNKAAMALYESEGFSEIGTRKNYYPADQGREDALVMAKSIIP